MSAGSSDSGPYMAGHSYISGRTFEQPINTPKSTYDLVRILSQFIFLLICREILSISN